MHELEHDKELVLDFINRHCVFHCNPDVQYVPGIPKGKIPGSVPGVYNTWQIYLRRLTQNPMMMNLIGKLFLDMMEKNNEPVCGFQIAGLETSSLPLIAAFGQVAHHDGRYYNTFSVRKDRKGYGLFNLIDGMPDNEEKVVVMDDIYHSGSSLRRVLDTSLYELDLDPHPNAYFILNLSKSGGCVFNHTAIKLNALFTRDDLDLTPDPERYWLPDDCGKHMNYRPDYNRRASWLR